MGCEFKSRCPSASGWCDSKESHSAECVPFLLNAYENLKSGPADVFYLCDRRACRNCSPISECSHTSNIEHAVNFERIGDSYFEEKEDLKNDKDQNRGDC